MPCMDLSAHSTWTAALPGRRLPATQVTTAQMAVAMVPHAAPGKLLRHAVGTPRGRLKGTARPWRGACVCSASAPGKRPTAAVIGSSIAGMLTAAALADTCDVVVVERDSMPVNELGEASTYLDAARQRHGVPQFSQAVRGTAQSCAWLSVELRICGAHQTEISVCIC